MLEVLEQIFVIECFCMAVHEPDFGGGVLLWNDLLLREKTDFFEGEFVVCVCNGNSPVISNCNPVFLAPFF